MTTADRIAQLLDQYPANASTHRWFQVKPNGGGLRPIATPNKELMKWLKLMNKALAKQFNSWPDFMHVGIKKRSYVTYARPHVSKPCVITIDIKRCFDSITEEEVAVAMQQHLKLDTDLCTHLARVLCFRSKVAQGFPTSNYICNLYLLTPLTNLHNALKKQGVHFDNYVDDLAASGAIAAPDVVVNEIALALSRASLKMNKAKVVVMPASRQQVICGLIVNKRLTLTRKLKLRLLGDIARGRMNSATANGWIANLKTIDPKFQQKLRSFARTKGLVKS